MYNIFVAEGDKICREFLIHNKYNINAIYALPSWIDAYSSQLDRFREITHEINARQIGQISKLKTPSEVVMVLEIPNSEVDYSTLRQSFAIYLDRLQDPGNVGTIIRIADWFGIPQVIASEETADFYNNKVVQSSMGSMLNVHLAKAALSDILDTYSLPVYGTVLEGNPLSRIEWLKNGLIVIGNEGKGISEEVMKLIDHPITIPGAAGRVADSLNASVATGIVCASLFQKRNK